MIDVALVGAVSVPAQPTGERAEDRTSAATLLAAADLDAAAVADGLHDGALQALVVARYAADAAVRGGSPLAARDAVQHALVALRRAVWLLRPRGAEDLPAALTDLSAQLVALGAPGLLLDVDAATAALLSPTARAVGYRFVQAAAQSSTASTPLPVRLSREVDTAVLAVPATVLEPAAWAARAAALGGRFDRGVAPGHVARLLLSLTDSDFEGAR
jgi:signal transduction histidine kinase